MNNKHCNSSNKPFSSTTWLDSHHSIKSRIRAELIHRLPINSGAKVLDIGCGTGQWSFLLAERVGHKGMIVGIDPDNDIIKIAEDKRKNHYLNKNIIFKCNNMWNFHTDIKFDLIILFNSLSYISNPLQFIQHLPQYLERDGAVLIKDTDIGSDFFWPINIELYHKLMMNINHLDIKRIDDYDPFFARKIPQLLHKTCFSNFETFLQSFSFCYPVDAQEREYIANNAFMISNLASKNTNSQEIEEWKQQFDDKSKHCIFNKTDFIYTMSEFLFYARTPSNS